MNIVLVYQNLLRLCPTDFYQKYAREMTLLFQESLRDVKKLKTAYPIQFLLFAFLDLLKTVFEQQFLKGKEAKMTAIRSMWLARVFCVSGGVFLILLAGFIWKDNLLFLQNWGGIQNWSVTIENNLISTLCLNFLTLFSSLSICVIAYIVYQIKTSKVWISGFLAITGSLISFIGQSKLFDITDHRIDDESTWWLVWLGLLLCFVSWCSLAFFLREAGKAKRWFSNVFFIGILSILGWGIMQISGSQKTYFNFYAITVCIDKIVPIYNNNPAYRLPDDQPITLSRGQLNKCLYDTETYNLDRINPVIEKGQITSIGLLCLIFAGLAWIWLGFQRFVSIEKITPSNLDKTSAITIPV
jgi:hypothetical protein